MRKYCTHRGIVIYPEGRFLSHTVQYDTNSTGRSVKSCFGSTQYNAVLQLQAYRTNVQYHTILLNVTPNLTVADFPHLGLVLLEDDGGPFLKRRG